MKITLGDINVINEEGNKIYIDKHSYKDIIRFLTEEFYRNSGIIVKKIEIDSIEHFHDHVSDQLNVTNIALEMK